MLVKLTKIGNSYGIRLPKNVIKECAFQQEINLAVEQKRVVLTAVNQERSDWREKIRLNGSQESLWENEWTW